MADNDTVKTSMSQLWVQEAPNGIMTALGCYTLGDIETPLGDVDQIMCQDPVTPGKYIRKALTKGAPGVPTTSIEGLLPKSRDYLEKLVQSGCKISLYWTVVPCAPKTTFNNYSRGTVIEYGDPTSMTKSSLMSRDSDDASLHSIEVSAFDVQDFGVLDIMRRTTAEINPLRDIVGLPFERCQSDCGEALETCDVMYIVCNRTGAASANVLYSIDGGVTWANTSADPFPVSEDISGIEAIMISNTTIRLIVANGTTAPALTARIAYADVNIVTAPATTVWTTVAVGATNAEFIPHHGSTFALDAQHIWVGTEGGRIYFSADAGLTWAVQIAGIGDDIRYIYMRDADVGIAIGGTTGASHVVYRTTDGGAHWTAITMTGPGAAIMATAGTCHDSQRLWVGFEDGSLYYSLNGGSTWTARVLPMATGATAREAINDLRRVDDYCMWIATGYTHTAAFWPAALRTVNGGTDWDIHEATTAIAADGQYFQSLLPCGGFNRAIAVGGVDAGPLAAIYDIYEM